MEAELPPLRTFILPGGHPASAWCHLARTTCRRCERRIVRLLESDPPPQGDPLTHMLVYINRLSDYLFVLARWCNRLTGTQEVTWQR
jgi:cob(I)alamin adenosyltransferase